MGGPAHKSGSRAPSSPSTALNTSAPSLPTHPPRRVPRCAISGRAAQSRAISRYLGRSRGRAALSRAISERRSRGVTPAQKGRAWLEPRGSRGRARSVLAASPCATWAGEAAPRAARPSPRPRRPLRAPLIFSPLGVTLALTQGNPAVLPSPHLRRVRSVLRPLAPVHVPRARPPRLVPRPNQQHARLMPGPNPLPGWCQGSMNLLSVSFPPPPRQD